MDLRNGVAHVRNEVIHVRNEVVHVRNGEVLENADHARNDEVGHVRNEVDDDDRMVNAGVEADRHVNACVCGNAKRLFCAQRVR